MEYIVESKWTGWFGGWGSETDIASIMTLRSTTGWRLVRTESKPFAWFWCIPRVKLLMVWERPLEKSSPS